MAVRTVAIWNRAASDADESALTDRDLLRRFADARDEGAFAVLVARHARMVLGICQRLLPTVQDAEDACQATFLILARKAGGGRWQTSAANWLYTTARRVAAKTRRAAARRAKREGKAAVPEAVPATDTISAAELLTVLDEELEKLPPRYREPLVLCYLEGLSREEAAARLGIPQGTVKTQLERGRHRLEAALTRRGVGVGLGLLALAVATPSGASPPKLVETILAAVSGPTPAVAALARGAVMNATLRKALVVVALSAAGLGIGLNAVVPAAESEGAPTGSALVHEPTKPAAVAPVPLAGQQAEEKFQKDIAAAREKAIEFLKKEQKDGKWEGAVINALADMEGGFSALVALSLLEAGVPANDPVVTKAIKYLVKLEPKKTYVVSLQTQVLARADAKAHKEQIQKNADWLMKEAIQTKGKLQGWSYPANSMSDNSNTHFAVVALHDAAQAGAKIDAKMWEQIREYYTRTQLKAGGWGYTNTAQAGGTTATASMTMCGLLGLAVASKHNEKLKEPGEAFETGLAALLKLVPSSNSKSEGYEWMAMAELGRAIGKTEFKSGDKGMNWYREGAEKLLRTQKEDGSWTRKGGIDTNPVLTTACGLYFLGPPK